MVLLSTVADPLLNSGWLLPPLAILVRFGVGSVANLLSSFPQLIWNSVYRFDFFLNILLTICGYIPGHGHNFVRSPFPTKILRFRAGERGFTFPLRIPFSASEVVVLTLSNEICSTVKTFATTRRKRELRNGQ